MLVVSGQSAAHKGVEGGVDVVRTRACFFFFFRMRRYVAKKTTHGKKKGGVDVVGTGACVGRVVALHRP